MAYRYPDTHVLYRKLNHSFPLAVRGEGCYLYDETGKRYLDGSGGAYVANLGHGVTEVADEIAGQMRRLAYVSGSAFSNEAVEALAEELAGLTPGPIDYFYFLNSGSDAVEAALKLARQHWVEVGRPGKHKIVALAPAYHGNTLLALSASAREHYKTYFREWLVPVVRAPAPYPYRCECRGGNPPCAICSGRAVEEAILREGPDTIAGFIGEPVGGSSTGGSVPRVEYWHTIRAICDRHDILWVADEILVGVGRTGTWSALEPYGAVPDIVIFGKGLSGGYAPLAAVGTTRRVLDPIARSSGAVLHAQTFSHNPVACIAGLAAVRYLKRHRLIERCARMAPALHRALDPLRELPSIGDVRGRGLLAGIEFVADKESRAPFPRAARFAETFTDLAQEAGLIVWPNVGQADGINGDLVMLAPPFIITEAEIDEAVTLFRKALDRTLASAEFRVQGAKC